ncbi:MAG: hypothetical protein AB2811_06660, partial [Candidatus Sedimenticola endophacoides]
MATIEQQNLFTWEDVEVRSDLDRLVLVRDHLPDERIIQYLEVTVNLRSGKIPITWHGVTRHFQNIEYRPG